MPDAEAEDLLIYRIHHAVTERQNLLRTDWLDLYQSVCLEIVKFVSVYVEIPYAFVLQILDRIMWSQKPESV